LAPCIWQELVKKNLILSYDIRCHGCRGPTDRQRRIVGGRREERTGVRRYLDIAYVYILTYAKEEGNSNFARSQAATLAYGVSLEFLTLTVRTLETSSRRAM
jgi:hypothetical protein